MLKQRVPDSGEWARLEPVTGPASSVADFVQDLAKGSESAKASYLFDWSLPLNSPELDQKFK